MARIKTLAACFAAVAYVGAIFVGSGSGFASAGPSDGCIDRSDNVAEARLAELDEKTVHGRGALVL